MTKPTMVEYLGETMSVLTLAKRLGVSSSCILKREHAAAFARPLISAKLLTKTERLQIRSSVKGRQRWNGGWLGESHESREARR